MPRSKKLAFALGFALAGALLGHFAFVGTRGDAPDGEARVLTQYGLSDADAARLGSRLARVRADLESSETFASMVDGLGEGEARALGQRMAARGTCRLDAEGLEIWARVTRRMAEVSPPLCAALWNGGARPEVMFGALAALDEAELDAYVDMVIAAQRAELAARVDGTPLPELDLGLVDAAFARVVMAQDGEGGVALRAALLATPPLPEAQACATFQAVLAGADALAPEEHDALMRSFACAGARPR